MTTQQDNNDQLPTVDVAELSANIALLTDAQREQLSTKIPTNKMDLFTAYMYIESFQRNPETANTFCIPAMLVAAIAGRAYQTNQNQKDIVIHVLRNYGTQGLEWDFKFLKDLFGDLNTNVESPLLLKFHLPCMENGAYIIRRNCGNRSKFAFLTPLFAMKLLMMMQSPRRDDFVSLGMAALSAVGSMLRGETVEVLDGSGNVVHSLGDSLAKGRGRKRKAITDAEARHALRRVEGIDTYKTLSDKAKEKFEMNVGRYAEMNGLVNKIATTMDKREWNEYHFGPGSKNIKNLRDHATFDGSVNLVYAQRVAERLVDKHDDFHSFMIEFRKQGEAIMAINASSNVLYVEPRPQMSGAKTKRICTTLALAN